MPDLGAFVWAHHSKHWVVIYLGDSATARVVSSVNGGTQKKG